MSKMNLTAVAMLDSNNLVLNNINGSDITAPQNGIVKFQLTFSDTINSMTSRMVSIIRPDGYIYYYHLN